MSPGKRSRWQRYIVAVLAVALVLVLKLLLNDFIGIPLPSILFGSAIALSTRYGGIGCGLLATGIAALVVNVLFLPPYNELSLNLDGLIQTSAFVLEGVFISLLCTQGLTAKKPVELNQSEEQLMLALEAAKLGSWDWHIPSNQVTWSKNHELLFGLKVGSFEGTYKAFLERIHPEDREKAAGAVTRALEEKTDYKDEFRIVWPDRSIHWISAKGQFFYNEVGQAVRMIGVCMDITERKLAEAALRESEARFRAASEGSLDAFFIFRSVRDESGRIVDFAFVDLNSRGEQLISLPKEQVIGQRLCELLPINRTGGFFEKYVRVVETREVLEEEFPISSPGIAASWLHHQVVPLFDGVAITSRDITDRKRAELEMLQATSLLRNSEEQFRLVTDAVPTLIGYIDTSQCYRFNNKTYEQWFGLSRTELTGKHVWEVLGQPGYQAIQSYLEAALSGRQVTFESALPREAGVRYIYGMYIPDFGEQGEVKGVVALIDDITERKLAKEELQNALQRLGHHVENSPLGVIEWNRNFQISRWSREAERIFGWQSEEVLGLQPSDWRFIFDEDAESVNKSVTRLWDGSEQRNAIRNRNYRKDGSVVHCEWYNSALLDRAGNLVSVLSLVLDVTERKQVEAERERLLLQNCRQREFLEKLVENAPMGIAVVEGPENRYLLANPTYRAIPGVPDVPMVGRTIAEVFPDVVGKNGLAVYEQVYRTGKTVSLREYETSVGSGREHTYWNADHVPLRSPDGQIEAVLILANEVTEEVQARRKLQTALSALQESEAKLRRLVESNIIGVVFGETDTMTDANDAFLQMVGYSREDLLSGNLRWAEMTPNEYSYLDARGVEELLTVGSFTRFEKEYIRKDGSRVPILIGGALLEKEPMSWVCFVLDLTELKQTQKEQQQLLIREREARQEAEAANRLKDEFLATLSHELRSPLNAILGWTQLIRSRQLDAAATTKAMSTIERNAKSQKQLIEDLLDVSTIITGKLRLNVRPVELVFVIESAIDTVRPAADAKAIQLQSVLDPSASLVWGDADRLQQVMWNLLSNAIKFTPKGGSVQVLLERVESYIEIAVSDTGQGISPDFLPYVFDRFRQADSSITRSYGGLGLGLAIVRHIVELHGGTVRVASSGEGQGATFTVQLPLMAVRWQTRERERLLPTVENSATFSHFPSLEGLRVLIIDDEADARDLISAVLEECGATVRAVASVSSALDAISQLKPDILVSDIGMPGEDGYTFIRKVRSLCCQPGREIPAVALTAYARPEDRTLALENGFQMHLSKPIDPGELAQAVANLAGRTG